MSAISPWGVYSVWHHNAQIYRRTLLINCIPPMTEPLLYLISFGYGLSPLIASFMYLGKPVTYMQFIAPGMVAIGVLLQAFFDGAYGVFIRIRYERRWSNMLTAPLTFDDIFLGDLFWAATKGLIAGILTSFVGIALGAYTFMELFVSLPLLVVGSILFGAVGMVSASVVTKIDQLNVPVFLVTLPMFACCGTYFPRDGLPATMRVISELLPMSWLCDLLRWRLALPPHALLQALALPLLAILLALAAHKMLFRRMFR